MSTVQVSQPLNTLAPSTVVTTTRYATTSNGVSDGAAKAGMFLETGGKVITWFIILTVFIWLILYSLNPSWVQRSGGLPDTAKILMWSLIIALAIVLLGWLLSALAHRGSRCY